MRAAPLTIKIAIAFNASPTAAADLFPNSVWESQAACHARAWLLGNGLLEKSPKGSAGYLPTEKLAVWINFICATPLPVQELRLPAREDAEAHGGEPHG